MGGFSELHQKKTVYWSYFTAWTIILTSEREEAEWLFVWKRRVLPCDP